MIWLRWILLLAGIVFIAALAWWERRRPHQAGATANDWRSAAGGERAAHAEHAPTLNPVHRVPPLPAERDPLLTELPTIHTRADPPLSDLPELSVVSMPQVAHEPVVRESEPARTEDPSPLADLQWPGEVAPSAEPAPHAAPEPIVDWPPEAQRRILSLRIASHRDERLQGRAVRLSLEALGFQHGRFGIFHQPGADGRAILSAASLSRPGVLDPQNMDFQRFSGLTLFAVLPGPMAPMATLELLLGVGSDLAARLGARLQDEQGHVLDGASTEQWRSDLQASLPAEGGGA